MANRNGFTLIELMVTLAITGIFFTLALDFYGRANGALLGQRIYHKAYFNSSVSRAKANRLLRENQGECRIGENDVRFEFIGEKADSIALLFPFNNMHCITIGRGRFLVYYLGISDTSQIKKSVGYGFFY